ncbi:MAG: hypothetical protein AAF298_06895 [Cyanobacteria bacterium P01_A01_bin.40]
MMLSPRTKILLLKHDAILSEALQGRSLINHLAVVASKFYSLSLDKGSHFSVG